MIELVLAGALPVNGRGRARLSYQGNMSAEEAAGLVKATSVRQVVPMHFDIFARNVDGRALARFLTAMADVRAAVHVPRLGRRFRLATEADR